MVCLAKKKVINLALAMSHLQVDHIQLAIANCRLSTWRWLI